MTTETPESSPHSSAIKLVIAVPARLGSTRLPRKPLALLGAKPLIVRVADRVRSCAQFLMKKHNLREDELVTLVATDSDEIAKVVQPTGIQCVMTEADLPSGTDRIHAAVHHLAADDLRRLEASTLVVNLQGDEPFFRFEDIDGLVSAMLREPAVPMGTLAFQQTDPQQFMRTSVVKVVCNHKQQALYFSRSPIPWPRESLGASSPITETKAAAEKLATIPFLQHVGVYAYRLSALRELTSMPTSFLENREGLEQLRALEAGWTIKVVPAQEPPFGIDTPDDLQRAQQFLAQNGSAEQ